MEVKIPRKLEKFTHGAVVKQLQEMNRDLVVASRTAWGGYVPDLVHKDKRIAVEVELSDLTQAWGQCLSYYRSGAVEIHLILTPKLHAKYQSHEETYIKKNPIPNVKVYVLPEVPTKKRGRPSERERIRRARTKPKPQKESKEKFLPPRPRPIREYITLKDGTTLKPQLTKTDRRIVGVDNVYFPVGDGGDGGNCPICEAAMHGNVYENLYGRKTVLYECAQCGHLEAKEVGE